VIWLRAEKRACSSADAKMIDDALTRAKTSTPIPRPSASLLLRVTVATSASDGGDESLLAADIDLDFVMNGGFGNGQDTPGKLVSGARLHGGPSRQQCFIGDACGVPIEGFDEAPMLALDQAKRSDQSLALIREPRAATSTSSDGFATSGELARDGLNNSATFGDNRSSVQG